MNWKNWKHSDYVLAWKSKGLSDKSITAPSASHNFFNPLLNYYLGTKIRVEFSVSCLKQDKVTYAYGNVVNIYIVYEINENGNTSTNDPTLENCFFVAVSLTKNPNIDRYRYSGYGIGFDRHGSYSYPSGGTGKKVIFFGLDMS